MTWDGVHNNYAAITGNGGWQYFTTTVFIPADHTTLAFHIRTQGTQATTYYVDSIQLESGSVAHNWITGGTTSSSSEGTIEMEVYLPSGTVSYPYLFEVHSDATPNRFVIYQNATNAQLYGYSSNNAGDNSQTSATAYNQNALNRITYAWSSSELSLFINGVKCTTPVSNPKLPSVGQNKFDVGTYRGVSNYFNAIFRKIHISRRKLSDTEIASRAATVANGGSYTVTKDTTFYLDGQYDLRGYKIATGG
jgi:hypothetical protein